MRLSGEEFRSVFVSFDIYFPTRYPLNTTVFICCNINKMIKYITVLSISSKYNFLVSRQHLDILQLR